MSAERNATLMLIGGFALHFVLPAQYQSYVLYGLAIFGFVWLGNKLDEQRRDIDQAKASLKDLEAEHENLRRHIIFDVSDRLTALERHE